MADIVWNAATGEDTKKDAEKIVVPVERDPNESLYILNIAHYTDNRGAMIQEHIAVHGTLPENYARFHGVGNMEINNGGRIENRPLAFPISGASTIQDAFRMYAASLQEHGSKVIAKMQSDIRRQQLMAPASVPARPPLQLPGFGKQ